jgi:selenocysteine-specific elongation factor
MSAEELRAITSLDPAAFDELIQRLGDARRQGPLVRSAEHEVRLSPEQVAERERVMQVIGAGGFAPPLAKELGASPTLLQALQDGGELIRIGDFYLTSDLAQKARGLVRERIQASGPVTVAEIRDLLSTTRKYAVPLCEWLDSTGATMRRGDLRIAGPKP